MAIYLPGHQLICPVFTALPADGNGKYLLSADKLYIYMLSADMIAKKAAPDGDSPFCEKLNTEIY